MDITMSTPALLFPALSLLLLAYTNRFVVLANLIRHLFERYQTSRDALIFVQIQNLRRRVVLIRNMQAAGILSMLLCVVCMAAEFVGQHVVGNIIFGASLLLMVISLSLSLAEILLSDGALNILLAHLEEVDKPGKSGTPAGD